MSSKQRVAKTKSGSLKPRSKKPVKEEDNHEPENKLDRQAKKELKYIYHHPYFEDNKLDNQDFLDRATHIKFRAQALRKIQLEEVVQRMQMEKAFEAARQKYHQSLEDTFRRRAKIIKGEHEPGSGELLESCSKPSSKAEKGIPDFWLNVLLKNAFTKAWIKEDDIPVLQSLLDIRVSNEDDDVNQFTLTFEFSKNEYFVNKTLTKTYTTKAFPKRAENPFHFSKVAIEEAEGCNIHWRSDEMNVTRKVEAKTQRNAKTGQTRTVNKLRKVESFFNFFDPPTMDAKVTDEEELLEQIEFDNDLGIYIRDKIIPLATLVYTNEFVDPDFPDVSDGEEESKYETEFD